MDVKFDAVAAEQLIHAMLRYCKSIEKDAREVLDILNNTEDWQDNQKKVFYNNIYALAGDLNEALNLEGDYMRTFYERVRELEE